MPGAACMQMKRGQGCRLARLGVWAAAVVLDPVGPDVPGVDRGELGGLAGAAQVGEEVSAVSKLAGLETGLQRAEDLLARMQALAVRPRPEVGVPALARSLPLLVAVI